MTSSVLSAKELAFGDLDGDGAIDVIAADAGRHRVVWMRGLGSGSFGEARDIPIPAIDLLRSVACLDVDDDGDLDLVTLEGRDSLTLAVHLSGSGGWVSGGSTPVGVASGFSRLSGYRMATQDLDGDGDLDLLLTDKVFESNPTVFGVRGGPGTFAFHQPGAGMGMSGGGPFRPVAMDVDRDGFADIVSQTSGSFAWWRWLGGAQFDAAVPFAPGPQLSEFSAVRPVDVDGDGWDELVVTSSATGNGTLYRAMAGSLLPAGAFSVGDSVLELDAYDIDLDGHTDLLARRFGTFGLFEWSTFAGDGAGGFALSGFDQIAMPEGFVSAFWTVDLDGDARRELLTASPIFMRRGAASPQGASLWQGGWQALTDNFLVQALAPVDWDGDGDPDVAMIGRGERTHTYLAQNIGGDRLGRPQPIVGGLDVPGAPAQDIEDQLVAADVDGDGRTDLVLVRDRVSVLWNEGGGAGRLEDLVVGLQGRKAPPSVVDFDGDGDLDIVYTRESPVGVSYLPQLTPRTFGAAMPVFVVPGTDPVRSLIVRDVDSDGLLDVATLIGTEGPFRIEWRPGTAPGQVGSANLLLSPAHLTVSLQVADLDGSDTLDFVWGNAQAGAVLAKLGDTGGQFPGGPIVLGSLAGTPLALAVDEAPGPGQQSIAAFTGRRGFFVGGSDRVEVLEPTGGLQYQRSVVQETPGLPPTADDRGIQFVDLDGDGDRDLVTSYESTGRLSWYRSAAVAPVGVNECGPAVPNSTGLPARIVALGSATVQDMDLALALRDGPAGQFALFAVGSAAGLVPMLGGGEGTLCIGGSIGRFIGPGQVGSTTAEGARVLSVDVTAIPQGLGTQSITPGETWWFQAWFRDVNAGAATSNLTDAVRITFG